MIDVAILIPFKNLNECRLRNLVHTIKYYKKFMPSATILVIEQNTTTDLSSLVGPDIVHKVSELKETLFCRGFLFNEGYNFLAAKYYILADGDCLPDSNILCNFSNLYSKLETTYIVPYTVVNGFNSKNTNIIIDSNIFDNFEKFEKHSSFVMVGGVTFISGPNFLKIGGYGHEFVGWGGEDDDLYNRCVVSRFIKTERLKYTLYHLWHPNSIFHGLSSEEVEIRRLGMPIKSLKNHYE